jgi:hypothetical protein
MTMLYPAPTKKDAQPSIAWIRSQYAMLSTIFASRNGEYQVLRQVFDGQFASKQQQSVKGQVYQDRVNLIYNIANATVRRYMDQNSAPPRSEGVPEGFELEHYERADKVSKFLEYIYACNNMPVQLMQAAYYQSLLDKAIWNIRPAPHLPHKIRIMLGVPDFYYPVTRGDDWQNPVAVIYGFRTFKEQNYMRNPLTFQPGQQSFDHNIEYWDENWFVRIEETKVLVIFHGLGFIPWYETHNLPIPHRFRGQGDVDQVVGMNEYLNILMGAMADMIAYAAAPITIVRGTKVGGTNLPFRAGAVWELERDAQAQFLQWSGTPPSTETQILRSIQAIEDLTGVSSPAFGREIPSGVSGSAVRSLTAGFNNRVGTKQTLLGNSLVQMNEGILSMAEKMFPDMEVRLMGENMVKGKDLGKPTPYIVRPRDFKGWYKNRVVFAPQDPSASYFQEMDKFKNELQSKFTTMKNIGITNVWDELQRIREEKEDQLVHANNMAIAQDGKFVPPGQHEADQQNLQGIMANLAPMIAPGKKQGVLGTDGTGVQDKQAKKAVMDRALKQNPAANGLPGGVQNPSDGNPVEKPATPDVSGALAKIKAQGSGKQNLLGRAAIMGNQIMLDNPADEDTVRQILGDQAKDFKFVASNPLHALPTDAIAFNTPKGAPGELTSINASTYPAGTQKKNQVEIRDIEQGFLSVVVLQTMKTNNATTYVIGVRDDKGSITPAGKTDPFRGVKLEDGELTRVQVGSISKRDDNGTTRWGLGKIKPVKVKSSPAKPSTFADVEKLFNGGVRAG